MSHDTDVDTEPKKSRGEAAEAYAEAFLKQQGLITRHKNNRCKLGEIDLIMTQGKNLVFVEVRLRNNRHFSSAAESVDYRKQKKIIRTAQHFLLKMNLLDKVPCRFDVIAFNSSRPETEIPEWIKDAFSA
jgi:putative endonuclease